MDAQLGFAFDNDLAAQAVERQPFGEIARCGVLAVDQQIVAIGPDQEIEQAFALRGQQCRPHRQRPGHVIGHQPLQEAAHILSGQANEGAVGKGCCGHGA